MTQTRVAIKWYLAFEQFRALIKNVIILHVR